MNVRELSRDQLIELKQDYICHIINAECGTSYGELADADEIVSDETIFDEYGCYEFSKDDFWCSSCIFDAHGGDSELNDRTGQIAYVVGPLDEAEYDRCETGPMYRIRFEDGYETAAFEDELMER